MPKKNMEEVSVAEDQEITVDMTQARTLEPLPPDVVYLAAVSNWEIGKSASGGRKLHYELTVVEPEGFGNRRVMEDLSLDNEFTLGRLQQLLLAIGFEETQIKQTAFKMPKKDDVLGLQCTVRVRTESSELYGDRSRIRSLRPASAFKSVTI